MSTDNASSGDTAVVHEVNASPHHTMHLGGAALPNSTTSNTNNNNSHILTNANNRPGTRMNEPTPRFVFNPDVETVKATFIDPASVDLNSFYFGAPDNDRLSSSSTSTSSSPSPSGSSSSSSSTSPSPGSPSHPSHPGRTTRVVARRHTIPGRGQAAPSGVVTAPTTDSTAGTTAATAAPQAMMMMPSVTTASGSATLSSPPISPFAPSVLSMGNSNNGNSGGYAGGVGSPVLNTQGRQVSSLIEKVGSLDRSKLRAHRSSSLPMATTAPLVAPNVTFSPMMGEALNHTATLTQTEVMRNMNMNSNNVINISSIGPPSMNNNSNNHVKRSKRKKDQAFCNTIDQEDTSGEPDTNIDGSLLSAPPVAPLVDMASLNYVAPVVAHASVHALPPNAPVATRTVATPPFAAHQHVAHSPHHPHAHGHAHHAHTHSHGHTHAHAHGHQHVHSHQHPHAHAHHAHHAHSHSHGHTRNIQSQTTVPFGGGLATLTIKTSTEGGTDIIADIHANSMHGHGGMNAVKNGVSSITKRVIRTGTRKHKTETTTEVVKKKGVVNTTTTTTTTATGIFPGGPGKPGMMRSNMKLLEARKRRTKILNKEIWEEKEKEEREKIKEFWLSLTDQQRRELVKLEKEAVLKKMKEQQKHTCSCSVCGRRRTVIEEELEMLYDAYYEELEHYEGENKKRLQHTSNNNNNNAQHALPPQPQAQALPPNLQHPPSSLNNASS